MDVRCERCQTEYELEAASVSEAGTQVQCTTCGHTFLVKRGGGPAVGSEEPQSAEWMLETSDGQVHRFRNLTSLQKWIIERKVTRQDKISRTGHAWRRLGEIVELAPFFDVVDDADRARAAQSSAAHDLVLEAEQARRIGGRPTPTRPMAPPEPVRREINPEMSQRSRPSSEIEPFSRPSDVQTSVVRVGGSGSWAKLLVGLGVAAGVAVVGIKQPWRGRHDADAHRAGTEVAKVASPSLPLIVPMDAARSPVVAVAAQPAQAPVAQEKSVAEAPVAEAPVAERVQVGDKAGTPEKIRDPARAAPGGAGRYDRLVADADRALENGAGAKAMKLYDQALGLKPNGAEAIAGLGYINLDRGRADIAIGYFERSLSLASYPPAIFGLAEAHRSAGDKPQAVAAYRRYLAASPGGVDAPAARRQIKVLEGAPPAAAAAPVPVAPPADPNATPPSPASVLSEPSK